MELQHLQPIHTHTNTHVLLSQSGVKIDKNASLSRVKTEVKVLSHDTELGLFNEDWPCSHAPIVL